MFEKRFTNTTYISRDYIFCSGSASLIFDATIKSGARWYVLSVCGQLKPHYKLVQTERSRKTGKSLTFKEYMELVGHPCAKGGSQQ